MQRGRLVLKFTAKQESILTNYCLTEKLAILIAINYWIRKNNYLIQAGIEINYYWRVGREIKTETMKLINELSSFYKEDLVFQQDFVLIVVFCIFFFFRLD